MYKVGDSVIYSLLAFRSERPSGNIWYHFLAYISTTWIHAIEYIC